uniref:Copper transport protein n=1 Tax=Angiostrongylus cantonensis TaxID=6313 RepID=A0A0K0CZJ2_ANGCA
MVWSCITIGLLGIGLEAIRSTSGVLTGIEFTFRWYSHLLNSHVLLHVFHAVVAYTLMLVFMTFSVFLCISLCLGLATGHFLFGNRRFTVVP